MSLSVLVVDDHPGIRTLLSVLIESDARLDLFGVAEHGRRAVELTRHHCPDLIICDVEMPVMGGLAAVPLLREHCQDAVIAMYISDPSAAGAAVERGADRVFDKSTDAATLLDDLIVLAEQRRG